MPMQATTTTPLFAATLRPDRPLRLFGGWLAYGLAAIAVMPLVVLVPGIALPAAVAFALGGAGLAGLAVRQSRQRKLAQRITLWPDQLEIASTDRQGARSLRRFDPAHVRLLLDRDVNEKTVALHLRAGQDALELGAFLSPEDRASFAKAFGTALRRARQSA